MFTITGRIILSILFTFSVSCPPTNYAATALEKTCSPAAWLSEVSVSGGTLEDNFKGMSEVEVYENSLDLISSGRRAKDEGL